jgi:hypothetical protein
MKALLFVACLSFLLIATSCKKETQIIREISSDWFLTNTTGVRGDRYLDLATTYNVNPQNVVIGKDSVVIKKTGLYHFEGTHHFWLSRQDTSFPVFYDLTFEVQPIDLYYTVASGITEKQNATRDIAGFGFAFDLYVTENTTIKLAQFYNNAASSGGSIYGTFGGYRKGE